MTDTRASVLDENLIRFKTGSSNFKGIFIFPLFPGHLCTFEHDDSLLLVFDDQRHLVVIEDAKAADLEKTHYISLDGIIYPSAFKIRQQAMSHGPNFQPRVKLQCNEGYQIDIRERKYSRG